MFRSRLGREHKPPLHCERPIEPPTLRSPVQKNFHIVYILMKYENFVFDSFCKIEVVNKYLQLKYLKEKKDKVTYITNVKTIYTN